MRSKSTSVYWDNLLTGHQCLLLVFSVYRKSCSHFEVSWILTVLHMAEQAEQDMNPEEQIS